MKQTRRAFLKAVGLICAPAVILSGAETTLADTATQDALDCDASWCRPYDFDVFKVRYRIPRRLDNIISSKLQLARFDPDKWQKEIYYVFYGTAPYGHTPLSYSIDPAANLADDVMCTLVFKKQDSGEQWLNYKHRLRRRPECKDVRVTHYTEGDIPHARYYRIEQIGARFEERIPNVGVRVRFDD